MNQSYADALALLKVRDRRIRELEVENASLRHDLEKSMTNHVADLNAAPQKGLEAPICRQCGHPVDFHDSWCPRDVSQTGVNHES
jgi:hypothetical protein